MEKKQSLLILKVIIPSKIVNVIQLNKGARGIKKAISFLISLSYHMAQSYSSFPVIHKVGNVDIFVLP